MSAPLTSPAKEKNFFAHGTAARRYAIGRPYFHPIVSDALRSHLKAQNQTLPFNIAIDIACGTGLSTRILTDFSERVIGFDSSAEMLAEAIASPNVSYQVAPAENLPLADASVDIATVALAFHWFDRDAFLREARRILRSGGHLVLYNHGFAGEMASQSEFARWNRDHYLARYPTPSRDHRPFTSSDAADAGFSLTKQEGFKNYWPFAPAELARYLVTQSNVIAAVEGGSETITDACAWITESVSPLFTLEQETFLFVGNIQYLVRK